MKHLMFASVAALTWTAVSVSAETPFGSLDAVVAGRSYTGTISFSRPMLQAPGEKVIATLRVKPLPPINRRSIRLTSSVSNARLVEVRLPDAVRLDLQGVAKFPIECVKMPDEGHVSIGFVVHNADQVILSPKLQIKAYKKVDLPTTNKPTLPPGTKIDLNHLNRH